MFVYRQLGRFSLKLKDPKYEPLSSFPDDEKSRDPPSLMDPVTGVFRAPTVVLKCALHS